MGDFPKNTYKMPIQNIFYLDKVDDSFFSKNFVYFQAIDAVTVEAKHKTIGHEDEKVK